LRAEGVSSVWAMIPQYGASAPSRILLMAPTEIHAAIALRLAAGSAAKGLRAAQAANRINNVGWTPSFTRRRSQVRVLSRPPPISGRYKQREELEGVVVTWIVTQGFNSLSSARTGSWPRAHPSDRFPVFPALCAWRPWAHGCNAPAFDGTCGRPQPSEWRRMRRLRPFR
jgi:hypothetical protein